MKKIICIGLTFGILFFHGNTIANDKKENFLSLRYEVGEMKDGTNFQGTYNVFDNNSIENWFLGCRFITGDNDFKLIIPHVFRKVGKSNWQVGVVYNNSNYDKKLGPGIRFFSPTPLKTFTIFTVTYYFDLEGNQNKVDTWLKITKNLGRRWQVGSEVWYYQTFNGGSKGLHIRPIRVGYKFRNVMPFIMLQRGWSGDGTRGDSILSGVEFKF